MRLLPLLSFVSFLGKDCNIFRLKYLNANSPCEPFIPLVPREIMAFFVALDGPIREHASRTYFSHGCNCDCKLILRTMGKQYASSIVLYNWLCG